MTKTDPLNPNVPAGSESPKFGDDKIRALARAVAELLNVDHYMGTDSGNGYNEDAAGEHTRVKFNAPISTPTNEADKMFIYGKDVNGKIELHCLDEDGNEIQLTSGGNLYSPLSKMETIQAVDSNGILLKNDGDDTVITVGDDGTATLAVGSQLATSAAPTADADIANMKYVNDQISAIGAITSSTVFNTTMTADTTWQDLDLSSVVGSNGALVFLEITASAVGIYVAKPKGSGSSTFARHWHSSGHDYGCCQFQAEYVDEVGYIIVCTDGSGIIQHGSTNNTTTWTIKVKAYVKLSGTGS